MKYKSNINAITEGAALHNDHGRMPRPERTWDLDAALLPSFADTKLPRNRDARRQGSWVTNYIPAAGRPQAVNADALTRESNLSLYERTELNRKKRKYGSAFRHLDAQQPCNEVAKQSRNRVAGSQGVIDVVNMRPLEVTDKVTGETITIFPKLRKYVIHLRCYGRKFTFSSSNRSKGTFEDGRDGQRKPLAFAKSELVRLLGEANGLRQFAVLTGADKATAEPLTSVNPATLSRSDTAPRKRGLTVGQRAELRQGRRAIVKSHLVRLGPPMESTASSLRDAEEFDKLTRRQNSYAIYARLLESELATESANVRS